MQTRQNVKLSVAPMMDWTDRHCRYFHRLMSRRTVLYTEMVTAPALVRGEARHLLRFDAAEHPVVLQLGGSDPAELAEAAAMGAATGYDEINLNVGCPSDRVQSGRFGAVLMKEPALVADCVAAMIAAQPRPVTVKCRIGVDDQDPAQVLPDFVARMADEGARHVIVHARKAWLHGLSPKENRTIPPLDHELVIGLRARFPDLTLTINGGIDNPEAALRLLDRGMHGAMVGRAAYHAPWAMLGRADSLFWGAPDPLARPEDAARAMIPYMERHLAEGGKLHDITRHMLGLFAGLPGARTWRRVLSEQARHATDPADFVDNALARIVPLARSA